MDLKAEVEKRLKQGKWKYEKGVVVGDTLPDFLVTTDNGDHIVIEVKRWASTSKNFGRAVDQVLKYQQLSKTAAALLVTTSGKTVSIPPGDVVPLARFLSVLKSRAAKLAQAKKKPIKSGKVHTSPLKKVFASMPFAPQYDDTFMVAIQPAALASGAKAARVDYDGTAGNVVSQIQVMIKASKVVVADLSGSRPNVLYELGFAEALGRPVIQICSTPTAELPFNVRNNQTLSYSLGQATKLKERLERELKKVI